MMTSHRQKDLKGYGVELGLASYRDSTQRIGLIRGGGLGVMRMVSGIVVEIQKNALELESGQ